LKEDQHRWVPLCRIGKKGKKELRLKGKGRNQGEKKKLQIDWASELPLGKTLKRGKYTTEETCCRNTAKRILKPEG